MKMSVRACKGGEKSHKLKRVLHKYKRWLSRTLLRFTHPRARFYPSMYEGNYSSTCPYASIMHSLGVGRVRWCLLSDVTAFFSLIYTHKHVVEREDNLAALASPYLSPAMVNMHMSQAQRRVELKMLNVIYIYIYTRAPHERKIGN